MYSERTDTDNGAINHKGDTASGCYSDAKAGEGSGSNRDSDPVEFAERYASAPHRRLQHSEYALGLAALKGF